MASITKPFIFSGLEVLIKKQVANRTSVHVIFLKVRHKCADWFILVTGSLIIQPDIFPIYNPISSFNRRIDNASRPDGSLSGNSTTTGRTGRQVPSFSFLQSRISGCPSHPHLNATCPGTPLFRWSFFHPRYLRQYHSSHSFPDLCKYPGIVSEPLQNTFLTVSRESHCLIVSCFHVIFCFLFYISIQTEQYFIS